MPIDRYELSRRRILAALGTIGLTSAGAGLGTTAYFSDQETFEDNRLVAGTLDMGVGYSAHYSDWSEDEGEGVDVVMYDGPADETGTAEELPGEPGEYVGLPANDAWLVAVDDPERFLDNTQVGAYPDAESDTLYRVNAGGDTLTALDSGPDWEGVSASSTAYFNGDTSGDTPPGSPPSSIDASVPADTPDEVFVDEIGDPPGDEEMHWEFDVPAGTQVEVRLYLADEWAQDRSFDVALEGTTVLEEYDPNDDVGHNVGTMKSFTTTSDGTVDVDFFHGSDASDTNPFVNAIEIVQTTLSCVDGAASAQADDAPKPVIEVEDLKPGDFGEVTFDFVLCDNPGYVWLNGALLEEHENGVTEPEADDPDEEEGVVELLDVVRAAIWVDDGNNYQNGDEEPARIGTLREILGIVGDANGTELTSAMNAEQAGGTGDQGCFAAGEQYSVVFAWWVPVDHGNEIQGDSARFDLGLYTEQCRHNDGSGLNNEAVAANETDDS
ncbi:SipW-dependent-type signal peptide-containing protein [Haloplanus halophilus]|uniref:SipW-dependent-type signal peptide-containing protein n=1 Tax=Haloplanus halophilus TaxID=2949993 RepID=UPI002041F1C4|nr:SipW-dependent-type signal peptide-containing protein [Haloplanus sp. GDY1]